MGWKKFSLNEKEISLDTVKPVQLFTINCPEPNMAAVSERRFFIELITT